MPAVIDGHALLCPSYVMGLMAHFLNRDCSSALGNDGFGRFIFVKKTISGGMWIKFIFLR
jgi:hypothetical protein